LEGKKMQYSDIHEIPYSIEKAVIINYNTKLVTTLSLLTAIQHCDMPVLLIDCNSTDESFQHFQSLMEQYEFDLLSAPLRVHGITLNWLFSNLPTKRILLIDSDLIINKSEIIDYFKEYIDEPDVFGCGFINGPHILTDPVFRIYDLENALYQERMWMPLVFCKVEPVMEALRANKSFAQFDFNNRYYKLQLLNKLASKNKGIEKIAGRLFNKEYYRTFGQHKPPKICYDTGAQIYEYLRYEKFMSFVGLPKNVYPRFVTHFHGATRKVLNPSDKHGEGDLQDISNQVRTELKENFGIEM
jgi:hypothetical protein